MRGLTLGIFALLLPLPAQAGTLTPVGPLPYDDSFPLPRPGCTHRFDGLVETGDLAQFQAIPTEPQAVVCLDSPGGAFLEGIAIGEYIREVGIGTRLEDGATCESACSVIFMSGSYIADTIRFGDDADPESWQLGHQPWRTMHPTARLGLHAPRLSVPSGQYDEATVTQAYDLALQSLARFTTSLMTEGPSYSVMFDPWLFAEMIATPHDGMFHIDTVGKAGRYAVEVGPIPAPEAPDDATLIQACASYYSWSEQLGEAAYADEMTGAQVRGTTVELANGLPCNFEKGGKDTTWRIYLYDVADLAFYPPDLPLSALAP